MLTTLRIKNLALVTDLTLELQSGCNVITGETGAGKSIIIGALNLVLGERADRGLIRAGEESCSVEAVFDVRSVRAPLKGFLEENGLEPCEDNQLVLKRTFTGAGTNRQFINGSPTALNVLATIGEWLVDMHGPHDHQSLLNPAKQLLILDAFGRLDREREAFGELVRRCTALEREKSALIVDEKTYAQQLDLLRFQVREISSARLQPGEETAVEEEFHRASNGAKLLQLSQASLEALAESENSLLTQAGAIGRTLLDLQRVDAGAANLVELHSQAVATLRDLQSELSRYAEKISVDPARLAEVEERLDLIHSLKRKYGANIEEINAFGEEAQKKLQSLESRDAELARINSELKKLDAEILKAGQGLTARRKKVIPQLAKAVSKQLDDLGFKQSKFDVSLMGQEESLPARRSFSEGGSSSSSSSSSLAGKGESHSLSLSGLDAIEFQFAPNPGEPPRPLRAIASSGEMARVMLALKTVLAAEDEIPVLVFDEVDANVGGETAHAVGEKMKQIAARRQVLCITHLPQVAAPASAHYVVSKQIKNGRTISEIELLGKKERVTELARMLGGQSDAARKHAEALLNSLT
ncbi:MAG TPA: DNA repair protein RecN [Verrucomicrobiae bacterium]|jgi:DNA repair protein RecN (Recombination protein N)|nr:DNA repair protein RecN [Verrucomicrobiae bacterium]